MRWSKKHIKILKIVFTFFLILTFIYLKPWISPKADALTITDNSAATFNTGTYTGAQYNSGRGGVNAVTPNKTASYDSGVKTGVGSPTWNTFSWVQPQRYGVEMPSNGGSDTGYTQNLSMANNQAYYKFNETTTGSGFADSSGNANTITQNGGVSPAITGTNVFRNTANTSGTGALQSNTQNNQFPILPNSSPGGVPTGVTAGGKSKYSIMMWINPGNSSPSGSIYEEAQGTSNDARISLRFTSGVLQFTGRALDSNTSTTTWVSATQTFVANNWYHIAAVYDSTTTTDNLKLFVDGIENSASASVPTFSNTVNATSKPRLYQAIVNANNKLVAKIDELAFFTRNLTATEVQGFYRRGAWNVGLFARTCDTNPCTTESYVGPSGSTLVGFVNDGTASTNTATLSQTFFLPKQFFQYRITFAVRIGAQAVQFLTGSTSSIINSVSIDYSSVIPPPTLSFAVRNTTDTANTNACVLGTAKTDSLSTCSYRLKVSTNSASGYTVYVKTSAGLSNGTHSMSNASAGSSGSGGTDISSANVGTEKYGVVITQGSLTSASAINKTSLFNAGTTNAVLFVYPSTPTAILQATGTNSPSATDTTNTSLITHKLNISNTSPPGNYSQNVTYTVTSTF